MTEKDRLEKIQIIKKYTDLKLLKRMIQIEGKLLNKNRINKNS